MGKTMVLQITSEENDGMDEEKEGDRHPPLMDPLQLFSGGCAYALTHACRTFSSALASASMRLSSVEESSTVSLSTSRISVSFLRP